MKIESQTNKKIQFLLILHELVSKTNMFPSLYANLLRKKNLEQIHDLSWFLD